MTLKLALTVFATVTYSAVVIGILYRFITKGVKGYWLLLTPFIPPLILAFSIRFFVRRTEGLTEKLKGAFKGLQFTIRYLPISIGMVSSTLLECQSLKIKKKIKKKRPKTPTGYQSFSIVLRSVYRSNAAGVDRLMLS